MKNRTTWNPDAWCAMFVAWCANQAGISTNIIPHMGSVQLGIDGFTNLGTYHAAASYTPAAGDIFFKKIPGTISHTGIVVAVSGNTFLTIDGNGSVSGSPYDQVRKFYQSMTGTSITGYGHPNYCYGGNHSASNSYQSGLFTHWHTCTLCGTILNEAAHTWVNKVTYYQCSVCGKIVTTAPGTEGVSPFVVPQ